jgi:prolipoprotein diacylglyceryltransferase
VQPSQLYNAAVGLLLFVILWGARRRFRVPGVMFWTFIVVFALVRIPIDLTRTWEAEAVLIRLPWIELTESQLTSLAMAGFGALMIIRLRRAAPAASPA